MATKEISIILRAKNAMAAGLSKAGESLKAFGSGVASFAKRATKYIAALGATIGGLGAYFVKAASDAQETGTKFDAVFSSIQGKANAMADALAKDFGLAGSSARKMLGDAGDLLVGFGFSEDAALKLADEVNRLSIDLASFTNYSGGAAGAATALTKLMLGETEQAKALGIVVRQGSDEYKAAVKAMMEMNGVSQLQAKAMVGLQMAAEQSGKAIGDYARTQDGLANRARLVKERFKEFREEIGNIIANSTGLNNVMKIVADKIAEVTNRVTSWAQNGGIERVIAGLRSAFERIKAIMDLRYDAALVLITGATAAAAIKVALLAKNSAMLSMEMNRTAISLAAKAVAAKAAGAASAGAAIKVMALKAAAMALSAVPWLALAAGFIAIGKATMDMVQATRQLEVSARRLQATEQQSIDNWGIRSPEALRKFRNAMLSGDKAMIDNLEKTHPKAVARWRELHDTVDKATDSMNENTAANGEQKDSIAELIAEHAKQTEAAEAAKKADEEAAKQAEETAKAKVAAEKKVADEKLALEEKLKDHIQKLEDEKKKVQLDAQQAVLDDAQKKADEQQKLAEMRVHDFIDAAKQEKDIEADKAKEAGRAAELEARVGRGVKLSKRDQEFLEAFNKIKEAQENLPQAQNDVLLAQQELARLQGDANRHLADIDAELKLQRKALQQNLMISK